MMRYYTGKLTKNTLMACFKDAKQDQNLYVGILIKTVGSETPELIVNDSANFDTKLEYLKIAYDNKLRLKHSPDKVSIVGIARADRLSDFALIMK